MNILAFIKQVDDAPEYVRPQLCRWAWGKIKEDRTYWISVLYASFNKTNLPLTYLLEEIAGAALELDYRDVLATEIFLTAITGMSEEEIRNL